MSMRAALYIRVSTEDQTEYSPDAQLRALREYAKKNKISIIEEHIYVDEGVSAKTANRPAFQRMLAAAKLTPKPFDAIIVHKLDRFARNREDSVVFKALLRRECGVKVMSATEPIEDDKFGIIIEAMLEAFAEFYSRNLAEEVKKGQSEKARRGGFMARPPYGYRIEKEGETPVIVPEEASIVKIIFDRYLAGMTTYGIMRYLDSELQVKMNTGHPFNTTRVKYILGNPMYCGLIRWNMRDSTDHQRIKDLSEWIIEEGQHEAIISREEYEKAQIKLLTSKGKGRPVETTSHWLSGLMRCGQCGGSMSYHKRKFPNFVCDYYSKGNCRPAHMISVKKSVEIALANIKEAAVSMGGSGGDLNLTIVQTGVESLEREILNRQLAQIPDKLQRIKEAFSAGIDSMDEYRENKKRILHEDETTRAQIAAIVDVSVDMSAYQDKLLRCYEILSGGHDGERYTLDEKKKAARSIFNRITFFREAGFVIEYYADGSSDE